MFAVRTHISFQLFCILAHALVHTDRMNNSNILYCSVCHPFPVFDHSRRAGKAYNPQWINT
jgi:hypothetical protein